MCYSFVVSAIDSYDFCIVLSMHEIQYRKKERKMSHIVQASVEKD